ncbi:hypothetical protein Y032_0053g2304 [Ancylostoma ceylanicum]|uniref:Uncharacterized protein n=1 Tax=Ancylostoma ceylanicum TaxID=53326 RepID=A0A016U7H4_9BILA|nr:hypothetical protein Y032_0053g2304 [Ancylostoma ceylanicum]
MVIVKKFHTDNHCCVCFAMERLRAELLMMSSVEPHDLSLPSESSSSSSTCIPAHAGHSSQTEIKVEVSDVGYNY